jgi:predicted CopG family antitoxin
MHKKLTITVEEDVYRGLHRVVGRRRISQFIEELVRPHVVDLQMREGYRQMAEDEDRERSALEWAEATLSEPGDEAR